MLRRGESEHRLLEAGTGVAVEVELAADPAVGGVPDVQPVRFLVLGSRPGQLLGEVGVRPLGGDVLQHCLTQSGQCLGVMLCGVLDQERLGLRRELGVQVGGQLVEAPEDRLGLLDLHRAVAQGLVGERVRLETLGQVGTTVPGSPVDPAGPGVPRRQRACADVAGQVQGLGLPQHPRPQRGGLRLQRVRLR